MVALKQKQTSGMRTLQGPGFRPVEALQLQIQGPLDEQVVAFRQEVSKYITVAEQAMRQNDPAKAMMYLKLGSSYVTSQHEGVGLIDRVEAIDHFDAARQRIEGPMYNKVLLNSVLEPQSYQL